MKKIILWIKNAVSRLTEVNETPNVELFEIDIMKELDFKADGYDEIEISNIKWKL